VSQVWNELRSEDGNVRNHWQYLHDAWTNMGSKELSARETSLLSLLRENGVTYNIYAEKHEKDWPLDILPLVIPSSEWSLLERGVIQRAELQSLLFQDLNGARRLVTEGILPPEFIFSHPEWLPSAVPSEVGRISHIPWVGVDLTRSANGQWRVLADRVQNPSGAGYALQNRVLLSKVFPSLYREAGVHRLVHWFRALRAELRAAAPAGVTDPHVVLLSPGPGHETWFEHSYMAAYMDLTLVRGQDLELRGDKIWMRAMGGDRPVDVILRRVNDAWCDPLYFRPDSLLGVPGLVRAVQAGTVTVVNPLGAGILNNPGILTILPKACKLLMGEELLLPSLDTWWCGNGPGLDHVLSHLNQLVLKPVFPTTNQERIIGSNLDANALSLLRDRIRANPRAWVGQEIAHHSMAPAWQQGQIVDRHMVLRTFACGNPRTGYRVMPGGLTRFGAKEHDLIVSNQDGGISKDTWILSSEPEREKLNREVILSVGVASGAAPLPAAAAESLFWAGRYLERSLVLIRRLREVVPLEMDLSTAPLLSQAIHCATGGLWSDVEADVRGLFQKTLLDNQAPGSVAFDLHWLVWNCRSLRGVIGNEGMAIVQRISEPVSKDDVVTGTRILDTISIQLRALASTFSEWSHDDPRRIFTELGHHIEWIHMAFALLQKLPSDASNTELRVLLEVDQGAPPNLVMMGEDVRQQAVNDVRRPRSLASASEAILSLLSRLPKAREHTRSKPDALALRLLSALALDEWGDVPKILRDFDAELHSTYFVAQTTPGWLKNG